MVYVFLFHHSPLIWNPFPAPDLGGIFPDFWGSPRETTFLNLQEDVWFFQTRLISPINHGWTSWINTEASIPNLKTIHPPPTMLIPMKTWIHLWLTKLSNKAHTFSLIKPCQTQTNMEVFVHLAPSDCTALVFGHPYWWVQVYRRELLRFHLEILRRMIGAFLRGKKGPRSWGGFGWELL